MALKKLQMTVVGFMLSDQKLVSHALLNTFFNMFFLSLFSPPFSASLVLPLGNHLYAKIEGRGRFKGLGKYIIFNSVVLDNLKMVLNVEV